MTTEARKAPLASPMDPIQLMRQAYDHQVEVPVYGRLHLQAWNHPRWNEIAMRDLITSWASYATQHQMAYSTAIGNDGVLGPEFAQIGKSLLALLNGDLGRYDGGTLDRLIRDIALVAGVNLDE